jgi:hypothetical protein
MAQFPLEKISAVGHRMGGHPEIGEHCASPLKDPLEVELEGTDVAVEMEPGVVEGCPGAQEIPLVLDHPLDKPCALKGGKLSAEPADHNRCQRLEELPQRGAPILEPENPALEGEGAEPQPGKPVKSLGGTSGVGQTRENHPVLSPLQEEASGRTEAKIDPGVVCGGDPTLRKDLGVPAKPDLERGELDSGIEILEISPLPIVTGDRDPIEVEEPAVEKNLPSQGIVEGGAPGKVKVGNRSDRGRSRAKEGIRYDRLPAEIPSPLKVEGETPMSRI